MFGVDDGSNDFLACIEWGGDYHCLRNRKMKRGLLELLLFEAFLWNISIQLDNTTVNITGVQLNYGCIKNKIKFEI